MNYENSYPGYKDATLVKGGLYNVSEQEKVPNKYLEKYNGRAFINLGLSANGFVLDGYECAYHYLTRPEIRYGFPVKVKGKSKAMFVRQLYKHENSEVRVCGWWADQDGNLDRDSRADVSLSDVE